MNQLTKNTIIALIAITMLIATTAGALAETWTTYTPNPAPTKTIDKIRTYSTYAMALTTDETILYYDGNTWNQIPNPTNKTAYLDFDKAQNGLFHWIFQNTTGATDYYQYNPATTTWIYKQTDSLTTNTDANRISLFSCIVEGTGYNGTNTDAECFLRRNSTHIKSYGTTMNPPATPDNSLAYYAGEHLLISTANDHIYRLNAFGTWVDLGLANTFVSVLYSDTNSKILMGGTEAGFGRVLQYNSSSGSIPYFYQNTLSAETASVGIRQSNARGYWSDGSVLKSKSYFNGNTTAFTLEFNGTTENIYSIDFDRNTDNAWIAGTGGFLASLVVQSSQTTISGNANPNPSQYGQDVIFTATATDLDNVVGKIEVSIYNSTGDWVYGWEWLNVQSGLQVSNDIGGIAWTNFMSGQTYNVSMVANFTQIATTSFLWSVVQNQTINETIYNITRYSSDGFTNINAIDNIGENNLFAVGKNGTEVKIVSYDFTNPNTITKKNITITGGASNPTSISIGNNTRLYVGTDDGLYIFNDSENADATQLTQHANPIDFLGKNYVYDLNSIDDTYAYVCQDGFIFDEARLFNYTQYDYDQTISENPCLTSEYEDDVVFIHKGTSGIKIYNATSQTLLSSTSGISSQPSGATHDRISKYNNYMFAITGSTQVSKYNITNVSNPVKVADCYTNYQVQAIEAVSENEVIIASTSALRACDFANNELYDAPSGKYVSVNIQIYIDGENPTEIIKLNDDGKIAVAEGNKASIYFYEKSTQQVSTNNPPQISSINPSTETPCINQTTSFSITATDAENDPLSYDYDCTGFQALKQNNYLNPYFECTYSTPGTKTIKAWVEDPTNVEVLFTDTISVQECAYANFLTFKVYDYDTGAPLSGVLVNVIGETSGTTNVAGLISFNLPTAGYYNVSFSKTNYFGKTEQYATSNNDILVYLTSTSPPGNLTRSSLIISVIDSNSQPLGGALVSATDPITGIAKITATDSLGQAILTDLATGVELRLSAGKTGYISQFDTTILANGETKTITMILLTTTQSQNQSTTRGCRDDLPGVFLCSPLNTSGNGDNCQQDSDCISGRCSPGVGVYRTCSKFNWTQCDAIGYDRANACFLKFTARGVAEEGTNATLDNFLYVLFFIGVIILLAIIGRAVSDK